MKKTYKQILALCLALVMALALFTGCASQPAADDTAKPADSASADTNTPADTAADTQTGDGKDVTITMAMVNCPVVQKLSELTKEYYKAEGVNIVIDVLEEENLRTKVTNMVTTGDNTYDLFMLGAYELATWINYGWLADLTPYMEAKSAEEMAAYDRDDMFPGLLSIACDDNGHQYAVPFFGESSFIMYNKAKFADAGITPTENPTWDDIYAWAVQLTDKEKEEYGFVMRGNVGWGASGCVFAAMNNSFGARMYDTNWNATFDTPEMKQAWEMFYKLAVDCAPDDMTNCTYNDCMNYMTTGKGAMWYDATSNASNLDTDGSVLQGNIGYIVAPNDSGWTWEWAFALNNKSPNGQAVVDFMLWASSKEYVDLTMSLDPTGASTPSGIRVSTYERDDYKDLSYAQKTVEAINGAKFKLDGNPCNGNQFLAIPEYAELGDYMTEQMAACIAGSESIDDALSNCNDYFNEVASEGGYK